MPLSRGRIQTFQLGESVQRSLAKTRTLIEKENLFIHYTVRKNKE